MVSATIILIVVVVLLLLLNFVVSRVPKRNQQVKVAFIPPSNPPSSMNETSPSVDFMGQLNAHIHATNVKITQLFSRMEDIEKRVFEVEQSLAPAKEEAWIETVPVRNKKK